MRYDYLLTLFTGHDDDFRPQLSHPFPQGDYIIATDIHSMVIIDKSECKKSYTEDEKTPNALSVFQKIKHDCNKIVCIDDLFSAETQFNIKYEYKPCSECDGEGRIMCKECGYDHECEVCCGTGTNKTGETQMRTKISAAFGTIQLGNAHFRPHIVDKLLNAMFILNVHSCVLLSNNECGANLFKLNEHCHVILMPTLKEEGGDQ